MEWAHNGSHLVGTGHCKGMNGWMYFSCNYLYMYVWNLDPHIQSPLYCGLLVKIKMQCLEKTAQPFTTVCVCLEAGPSRSGAKEFRDNVVTEQHH